MARRSLPPPKRVTTADTSVRAQEKKGDLKTIFLTETRRRLAAHSLSSHPGMGNKAKNLMSQDRATSLTKQQLADLP